MLLSRFLVHYVSRKHEAVVELAILASRPTRLPFSPCSLTAVLILGLR